MPLEVQGYSFLCHFCGSSRFGLFCLLFALHLDSFPLWVLMRKIKIAELFLVTRVVSGGLSNRIKLFSLLWAHARLLFPFHSMEVSQVFCVD